MGTGRENDNSEISNDPCAVRRFAPSVKMEPYIPAVRYTLSAATQVPGMHRKHLVSWPTEVKILHGTSTTNELTTLNTVILSCICVMLNIHLYRILD